MNERDVITINRLNHYMDALYTVKRFFDENDENIDYLQASMTCTNAIKEIANGKLEILNRIGGD